MEKITFEQLKDLIANIDYLDDESYPVCFDVTTNGEKREFECGITSGFEYDGEYFEEYQYFGRHFKRKDYKHFINVEMKDADDIVFDEIEKMLNKYCNIENGSVIRLLGKSFKGKRKKIKKESDLSTQFVIDYNIAKFENNLTKEVSKGIEWFKNILGVEKLLISTKQDSFVDLNNMNGTTFSFIFDRKVLYYDELTSALCTYCPNALKTKGFKSYMRIEANDNFKWILLYICNGEDLLSSTKVCHVIIENEIGEKKIVEGINNEKVSNWMKDTFEKALTAVKILNGE